VSDGLTMNTGYRFTRQQRLLKSSEYQTVFNLPPYKSTDRYLTVLAQPNQRPFARLGLAITKKRLKQAVDRNRIKRLARESFRHYQYGLAGLDCVVLAKTGIKQANNHTLLQSLARHWQFLSQKTRRCKKL
jgi:ribonuclease P protein component